MPSSPSARSRAIAAEILVLFVARARRGRCFFRDDKDDDFIHVENDYVSEEAVNVSSLAICDMVYFMSMHGGIPSPMGISCAAI